MTLLEWKPQYSVGIESMDFEHRQMIDLINELHAELEGNRDEASVEQFLGDIHAAIAMHFALEERIMQDAGYDEYAAHKEDHEDLLEQIRGMMDRIGTDAEAGLTELGERLSDWFAAHFSSFDARMHGKLDAH
jgi:hemerythrin